MMGYIGGTMRTALILGLVFLMNSAQAKVVEKAPTVETPNAQAEILSELDEVNEDIDFDTEDDLFINTIDESELIIDAEIEQIATEKSAPAPVVEAKAPQKTNSKKK